MPHGQELASSTSPGRANTEIALITPPTSGALETESRKTGADVDCPGRTSRLVRRAGDGEKRATLRGVRARHLGRRGRDSPFLVDLNRDAERLSKTMLTFIWAPLDLMIIPADSSRLPVGSEAKITVLTHQ